MNIKRILLYVFLTIVSSVFASDNKNNIFFTKIDTEQKIIFLTFDDGPGRYTQEVLQILDKYDIKATFFVLGELVRLHSLVIKKIIEKGHTIGTHTYSHKNFYQLQKKKNINECKTILVEELELTEKELKKILGADFKIKFLRMPNGYYRKWMNDIVKNFGYKVINWTFGCDWHNISEEEMLEKYIKALQPGGIYLFHDGGKDRKKTIKVLDKFIKYCMSNGYKICSLDEWIK